MIKICKNIYISIKDYINKLKILKKIKINTNILSRIDKDCEKYNHILLENILLKIKLIYQYNYRNFWFDMFRKIEEYMMISTNINKEELINILKNTQKEYSNHEKDIQKLLDHINVRFDKYTKHAKIFSCEKASVYRPKNDKTIMIRLIDTPHLRLKEDSYFTHFPDIKYKNKFYKIIDIYVDDVDKNNYEKEAFIKMCIDKRKIPFNAKMAEDLLKKINEATNGDLNKYDLVTHCRLGKSRSTAIFIALNEIYNLGYRNLKNIHIYYNRQIYNQMIESAYTLNIYNNF
jgi:predicted protein tyrosine phosphatase